MSWRIEDEKYLLKNWKLKPLEQIMASLGKTKNSIVRKAGRMGLDTHKAPNDLLKKKWTIEEDQFMIDNYNFLPLDTIINNLKRSRHSVLKRAQYLNLSEKSRRWTESEIYYLEEKWGILSIEAISKKLNRSTCAVSLKACQLSLREQVLANGYFLTPKYISEILNVNVGIVYNSMLNGLLHFRKFNVGRKIKYQISIDSFLDFLKNNLTIWDSKNADIQTIKSYYSSFSISKNDKFSLTVSLPEWLQNKIQEDAAKTSHYRHNLQWTIAEDKLLLSLKKSGYSLDEISVRLNRTPSSIKTRFYAIRNNSFNPEFMQVGAKLQKLI